jgi:hypothetical protein
MNLEQELIRLAQSQDREPSKVELPVEGDWTEWSPVPFGKLPHVPLREPDTDDEHEDRRAA